MTHHTQGHSPYQSSFCPETGTQDSVVSTSAPSAIPLEAPRRRIGPRVAARALRHAGNTARDTTAPRATRVIGGAA